MTAEKLPSRDPRVDHALVELQASIKERYPSATFEVALGDDPPGTYLWATVDIEETDQVLDPLVDRLLELQIDQGLPIHVVPVRTPERVKATIQDVVSGRRTRRQLRAPSIERALHASE